MEIEKLTPFVTDYIWGGCKLIEQFGVVTDKARAAEAWVLSMHKDGESLAGGKKLSEAVGKKDLGKTCARFGFFPVLVKLIDAKENLSVQVHPSDEYALEHENSYGKTEMWYVVAAEKGAGLYVGLKETLTRDKLNTLLNNGGILNALNFFPVKKGDCFFIPAGTIHAIGAGCTICEVQQNSNLTYRLYDYNRTGADGTPRPLHIEKALAVADLNKYEKTPAKKGFLAKCGYFTVKLIKGTKTVTRKSSFTNLVALTGGGKLNGKILKAGDSYFIPAGVNAEIEGTAEVMEIYVGAVKNAER